MARLLLNIQIEVLIIDTDDSESAYCKVIHFADTITFLFAVSKQHVSFADHLTTLIRAQGSPATPHHVFIFSDVDVSCSSA